MFLLSLKETGAVLGTIDESDLQVLIDQLEEENSDDIDYYITRDTIDLLAENGASPALLTILKAAVGSSKGVEVAWTPA